MKRSTSPEVLGRRQTIMGLMWKNACHAFTETTFPIFQNHVPIVFLTFCQKRIPHADPVNYSKRKVLPKTLGELLVVIIHRLFISDVHDYLLIFVSG